MGGVCTYVGDGRFCGRSGAIGVCKWPLGPRNAVKSVVAGVLTVLLAAVLLPAGCGGAGGTRVPARVLALAAGSVIEARVAGDWDDVDAALEPGLERAELATLTTERSDDRRAWELVNIAGVSGRLVVMRDVGGGRDARGCEQLTLTASMPGPEGNEQAYRLVTRMAERLEQLAGVEWAPMR